MRILAGSFSLIFLQLNTVLFIQFLDFRFAVFGSRLSFPTSIRSCIAAIATFPPSLLFNNHSAIVFNMGVPDDFDDASRT